MKMHLEPFDLPKVKEQHYPGLFNSFEETVNKRIDELKEDGRPISFEMIGFFGFLLKEIDPKDFFEMQQHFLNAETTPRNSDHFKYIDPIIWFESKIRVAILAGLNKCPPMRILDFGTGPGHFPMVARYYGHEVVGTDLPLRSSGMEKHGHLYDALCELYKVQRISHRIYPMKPLKGLDAPYDMVTAFLAAFNMDENKQPWNKEYWEYFLTDVADNVCRGDGKVLMSLANNKLTPEVWEYLKSFTTWNRDQAKLMYMDDLLAFKTIDK